MSRHTLALLSLSFLLPAGCVLQGTNYEGEGEVLTERTNEKKETKETISASYLYPDVRLSLFEDTKETWTERTCARVVKGEYEYSVVGDATEVVLGPVLFASAIGETFHNFVFLDFSTSSISDNFSHLVSTLPGINNQDFSKNPEDDPDNKLSNTGEVACKGTKQKSLSKTMPMAGKTINIVAEDGTILYQVITNKAGEAFINVHDAYKTLFKDGLKPVRAVELVSGKSCELQLDPNAIRAEAIKAGDSDPISES